MRFGFLLNEVLTGLRRNVTMTIAMILTTAISIGLFGGGLLVVRLADHSRAIYLDRVETQVFLTEDVSANDPGCTTNPCKALREKMDPGRVNGGVFLGLDGVVIKSHGGADAESFAGAIEVGYDMVRQDLLANIRHMIGHASEARTPTLASS